jgi:hypothetical protein
LQAEIAIAQLQKRAASNCAPRCLPAILLAIGA